MFRKIFILGIFSIFFIACSNEEQISSNFIFDDKKYSQENIEKINELDKKSYKEIAHFFKDNVNIKNDKKNILMIFSANNCTYCDKLKKEILKDKIYKTTSKMNILLIISTLVIKKFTALPKIILVI